ncbi:MAG TPA: class I SAM-dependent methyltransferase [Acidimicrobiales bacterium]
MLRQLETVIPPPPGKPDPISEHPMRHVTRQVAFERNGWTPERAGKVEALFDDLASEWHTRGNPERRDAVHDALGRGGPFPGGTCLELGSGIGLFTETIRDAVAGTCSVVAVDLSLEMLRRAPAGAAPRLQADASTLPFANGAVATAVLVNMLLFPLEIDRVLRPDGVLVWVNTLGDATPIHLVAADVAEALPGEWTGVHADAGWGTWAALRRA